MEKKRRLGRTAVIKQGCLRRHLRAQYRHNCLLSCLCRPLGGRVSISRKNYQIFAGEGALAYRLADFAEILKRNAALVQPILPPHPFPGARGKNLEERQLRCVLPRRRFGYFAAVGKVSRPQANPSGGHPLSVRTFVLPAPPWGEPWIGCLISFILCSFAKNGR